MNTTLILTSETGRRIQIKCAEKNSPLSVKDMFFVQTKVYDDQCYDLDYAGNKEPVSVYLYVNGDLCETVLRGKSIYLQGENRKLFSGVVGFAQISLNITFSDGSVCWLYSEYMKVLVRPTIKIKTMSGMLQVIYDNQRKLSSFEPGKTPQKTGEEEWFQTGLLSEIAGLYEESLTYFRSSSRGRLIREPVIDRIEKLQYVKEDTLRFILQHPEYLKQARTGLSYQNHQYLPTRTLMEHQVLSRDTRENRAVVGFLWYLYEEVRIRKKRIAQLLLRIRLDSRREEGYIVSSHLLHVLALDRLAEGERALDFLEKKYRDLAGAYGEILGLKPEMLKSLPEPDAVFLQVPVYQRLYLAMQQWFTSSKEDIFGNSWLLSFFNAPAVYEVYTLITLIEALSELGFTLKSASYKAYPKQAGWMVKNKPVSNTFVFSLGDKELVLYYEPILYDENREEVNGIHLYRNNSISLNRETEEERKGRYYVPDFLLCLKEKGQESYLICDAKFSRQSNVIHNLIPDLIYKYLVSLSPVKEGVSVKGLYVFYGIPEENKATQTFFDRQIRPVTPLVEALPLGEGMVKEDIYRCVREMLYKGFGLKLG